MLSPMLVVMALSAASVLACHASETSPPEDRLITAPDGVLMKICSRHLDLTSAAQMSRTCKAFYHLLSPTLRALHDILKMNLPASEFNSSLLLFLAFPPDLSGRFDPLTALALYDRCPAGRYDIIGTLIDRVHPIIFGALIASKPKNDRAVRAVLALASECGPLTLPDLPDWDWEFFTSILNDILRSLKAKLNPALHAALSFLGDPFCRIFPHNEQVAELLLTRYQEMGQQRQLENHEVLLALAWRGIRFPAQPFMSSVARHPRFADLGKFYRVLRIEETPEHLLQTFKGLLSDSNDNYRRCQRIRLYTCLEFGRRLERLLKSPLETFPWAPFCQLFELNDQEPHSSTLSNTLFELASTADRIFSGAFANMLRSCAAVHGPADSDVVKAALNDMYRSGYRRVTPAQFDHLMQGQHYCNDCLLDTIWYILDLDVDLGRLFAHFLAMPDVRDLLLTTRRATLVRVITNAIDKSYRFYVDSLEQIRNIPEIVTFLYKRKMAFVDLLGALFLDQSVEALAGLQAAMRLPFWSEIANLAQAYNGATLLHAAYYYHNQGAARLLLSDPSINRKCVDSRGFGPLHHYLGSGRKVLKEFVFFLRGLPIEDIDYHDQIVQDIERVFQIVQPAAGDPEPDFIPSCFDLEIMQPLLKTHGSRLYAIAAKYGQQRSIPTIYRSSEVQSLQ